jgi:hypothetical protein
MNTELQIVALGRKMAALSLGSLLAWTSVHMLIETSTTCRVAALW